MCLLFTRTLLGTDSHQTLLENYRQKHEFHGWFFVMGRATDLPLCLDYDMRSRAGAGVGRPPVNSIAILSRIPTPQLVTRWSRNPVDILSRLSLRKSVQISLQDQSAKLLVSILYRGIRCSTSNSPRSSVGGLVPPLPPPPPPPPHPFQIWGNSVHKVSYPTGSLIFESERAIGWVVEQSGVVDLNPQARRSWVQFPRPSVVRNQGLLPCSRLGQALPYQNNKNGT